MSELRQRAEWLKHATGLLEGLLNAVEPHQLEAFHAYRAAHPGVSLAHVAAARDLLLLIVVALKTGDAEAWERLSLALAATLPEEPPVPSPFAPSTVGAAFAGVTSVAPGTTRVVDQTLTSAGALSGKKPVDSTMPAIAPPITAVTSPSGVPLEEPFEERAPASTSIDETVALSMSSDDLERELAAELGSPSARDLPGDAPESVLDIDKYAALCAWSQVSPARREALHRQYGLADEAERKLLDQHFESLFKEDARLRIAFAQRLNMHLKFLRAATPSP
ncbi:MAG: hypothetical protein KC731_30385 [Myxococcales bacterium]|nr:hypothetical protein [Myxococcales bacterium]